jgi:hypothetical protein
VIVALGFALALVLGYPLLVGATILCGSVLHNRARLRRGSEAARSAIALGYSVDAVTELLLQYYKLPSMAVVRAISIAAGIPVSEAQTIVLPHLRRRQRKALAHWPLPRLERALDRFYPA